MTMFQSGGESVVALSQLAAKVYAAYKDAPDDSRQISEEVMSLQVLIDMAGQYFQRTTFGDNTRQLGHEVYKSCYSVLEDLGSLIEKYHSLSSVSISQSLNRVKLGEEDCTTLRARLISSTNLLSGFIQGFDIPTTPYSHSVYHAKFLSQLQIT